MVKFYSIKNKQKINKKAQAWSLDAMISVFIFFLAISILFFYSINFDKQTSSSLDDLMNQGNTASNLLLSNEELGIFSNNLISQTRLNEFNNADYQIKKSQLGIRDNFYFILDNLEVNGVPVDYVGNMNTSNVGNSIKIERIASYKNKPSKFELYIWK